jgi:flagellar hook-length control protein FliK
MTNINLGLKQLTDLNAMKTSFSNPSTRAQDLTKANSSQSNVANESVNSKNSKLNEKNKKDSSPSRFSEVMDSKSRLDEKTSAREIDKENSSQPMGDESNTDKLQSKSQDNAQKKSMPKVATREEAMSLFLVQMQKDLGVDPEDIMEAFSNLDAATLMSSPEDSAKQVIAQLGLDTVDSKKANTYYQEMLAMTAAANMNGMLSQSGKTANVQVMTEEQARKMDLSKNLDQMNDQFFIRGPFAKNLSQKPAAQGLQTYQQMNGLKQNPAHDISSSLENQKLSPDSLSDKIFQMNPPVDGTNVIPAGAQDAAPVVASDSEAMNAFFQQLKSEGTLAETTVTDASVGEFNLKDLGLSSDMGTDSALDTQSLDLNAASLSVNNSNPISEFIDQEANSGDFQSEGAESIMSDDFDKDADAEDFDQLIGPKSENGLTNAKDGLGVKNQSMMAAPMTETDRQENIKEIINQSQFLVKKGGGEMKMKLSPEGMGEISLRVKMVDGQVNVEMVTSSDEAKKVLEKGLNDLKESLAGHKLHLDSIKIENTKDTSNQLADQRQDLERSFQQKFMNDFRDRNQSMRNEFMEVGTPRMAKSQTEDIAANAQYDYSKRKKTEGGRRLDLVA